MKHIAALVLGLALALGGCAQVSKVAEFVSTATQPVSEINIYRVKNLYAAALQAVVEYRRYCWARPYAVLMADPIAKPICEHRRPIMVKIQEERPKVRAVINSAAAGQSPITVAWQAVNDFSNIIPRVR